MMFISHSGPDSKFALEVTRLLQGLGHDCWIDVGRFPVGERFVTEIGGALHRTSTFLLIDSEAARSSYWVNRELLAANRLHQRGQIRRLLSYPVASQLYTPKPALIDCVVISEDELKAIPLDRGVLQESPELPLVQFRVAHSPSEPSIWLGFSDELNVLDEWWHGGQAGLWLSGVGGSGKTALVWTWLRALERIGYGESVTVDVSFWSFYEDQREEPFLDFFRQIPQSGRTLIILDGMETMVEPNSGRLISSVLQTAIQKWTCAGLKIIVSSRTATVGDLAPAFDSLCLKNFSDQEIRMLFDKFVVSEQDHALLNEIGQLLGGHPLSLVLVRSLLAQGREGGLGSILRNLKTQGDTN